jgi:lipopolysaccharide/colanic/teichoic acid biosynthesis glycosyltransferase
VFNNRAFHSFEFTNSSVSYSRTLPKFEKREDDELTAFLWKYADITSYKTMELHSGTIAELSRMPEYLYDTFLNLKKINQVSEINNYLKMVNRKLEVEGTFICCVETLEQRRERLAQNYQPAVFYLLCFFDFLVNRVLPKLLLTRKLYLSLAKSNNRALSLPETLGRMIYCGFRIITSKTINDLTYIVVKKEKEPLQVRPSSDGMLIKMNRIGKNGKVIKVYKLRTMYTFSEYLQKYVYETNSLKAGGKFKNDFRITRWGKVLRKYWLDELPMLINLLKGELKIVGFRPLTEHYLSLYNEKLAEIRSRIKPGLIPPFYCDLPKTFEEIMESEERYVQSYIENPFATDVKYFIQAMTNIFFRGARSS